MVELPYRRIEEVRTRFPGAQAQMVLASIADGNTHARCWLSSGASGAVLLWDQGNEVFYLAGAETSDGEVEELAALFADTIWAAAAREGLRYLTTRVLSPHLEPMRSHLEPMLAQIFAGVALHPLVKRFYAYTPFGADPLQTCSVPAIESTPVEFVPIDESLLRSSHAKNASYVADEVRWMWPSLERFCAQGFGVAAQVGERLVCWCTAEYVSGATCGIGIETVGDFQGKGIATAAAARFVAEALSRGIQPHWECNAENGASARVAEKAGFRLVEESIYWAGGVPADLPGSADTTSPPSDPSA